MNKIRALTMTLLCVVGAAVLSASAVAADVTVFAAASLQGALDEQIRHFQSSTGRTVTVAYGATNTLAKQIEAGAPADLFVSADLDWMDYLEQRSLLTPRTRVNLLRNTLVLIAPAGSNANLKIGPGFDLSTALGSQKLAMANPDSVPAGKYGKSALQAMGVWTSVEQRVVRAENVRSALVFVSRGEAPFGIVYATDARADKGVRVVDTFPRDSHPPIVYPGAVIASSKSPAASSLLRYLHSAAAKPLWQAYGFDVPE